MRVLVIEHDPTIANSIRAALDGDHDVVVEADSVSGYARAVSSERTGEWFQLVICEAHMVGIDGPDLLAALRACRDPPIVMFVAHSEASLVDMQVDAMITVPFAAQELRAVVQALLAERAKATTRSLRRVPL